MDGSKGVGKGDVAALQNPPRIHGGNKSDGWTRSQELTILISNCIGPGSSGGHDAEDSSGHATGDQDGSSVKGGCCLKKGRDVCQMIINGIHIMNIYIYMIWTFCMNLSD